MAISRDNRYSSSCSKQTYSTLAWPLCAMFRAIWSDIVVLPVPCAPPISSSSPARMPPPSVRSSGEKPSGIGWYSLTAPRLTFSDRPDSTSRVDRGWRIEPLVSACHSLAPAERVADGATWLGGATWPLAVRGGATSRAGGANGGSLESEFRRG